jgi:hypothetical protein
MRDLNMSIKEVSSLTYSQVYTLMQCLRESRKGADNEYKKQQAFLKLQGKL